MEELLTKFNLFDVFNFWMFLVFTDG